MRPGVLIIDRGLPFPIKAALGWQGSVHLDWPSIEDSGVERMTVRFRHTLSEEHHAAKGFNAIQVGPAGRARLPLHRRIPAVHRQPLAADRRSPMPSNPQLAYASNVWVRNVRILNSDDGIFFAWVHRSAILDVTLGVTASRVSPDHPDALNGHHGVSLGETQTTVVRRWVLAGPVGQVKRLSRSTELCPNHAPAQLPHTRLDHPPRLQVAAPFIHDISVSSSASMNVVADSAGWNLNLDHHRCWVGWWVLGNSGRGGRPPPSPPTHQKPGSHPCARSHALCPGPRRLATCLPTLTTAWARAPLRRAAAATAARTAGAATPSGTATASRGGRWCCRPATLGLILTLWATMPASTCVGWRAAAARAGAVAPQRLAAAASQLHKISTPTLLSALFPHPLCSAHACSGW